MMLDLGERHIFKTGLKTIGPSPSPVADLSSGLGYRVGTTLGYNVWHGLEGTLWIGLRNVLWTSLGGSFWESLWSRS